jgi:type II secretory pathway pseudopilin PulG
MRTSQRGEAGFTLIEALISIVILVFGLAAVTNLFLVGGTSNQTANHMSATTAEALETLEALKAVSFANLNVGGDLDADIGTETGDPNGNGFCDPDCLTDPNLCPTDCVSQPTTYNYYRTVPGVGMIRTRWRIDNPIPGAAGAPVCFIRVRSESVAPLVGGIRSRAEFTTFRTCTTANCPLECF